MLTFRPKANRDRLHLYKNWPMVVVVILFALAVCAWPKIQSRWLSNQGLILIGKGENGEALPSVQAAAHTWSSSRVYYWLGVVQISLGDTQAGRASLMNAVQLGPEDPFPHLGLAQLYLAERETQCALEQRAAAFRHDSVQARAKSARWLCAASVGACVSEFDALLATEGLASEDRYAVLVQALEGLMTIRSPIDAQRYSREAVQSFPRDPYFHFQLGNSLVDTAPDEALDEAVIARDSGYEASSTYALFGKIYARLGYTDQSIVAFEQSKAGSPNDPWVRFWLGSAYQRAGRPEDAIREWRQALRIAPEFEEPRRALETVAFPSQ